jgi:hypothetical protein
LTLQAKGVTDRQNIYSRQMNPVIELTMGMNYLSRPVRDFQAIDKYHFKLTECSESGPINTFEGRRVYLI